MWWLIRRRICITKHVNSEEITAIACTDTSSSNNELRLSSTVKASWYSLDCCLVSVATKYRNGNGVFDLTRGIYFVM